MNSKKKVTTKTKDVFLNILTLLLPLEFINHAIPLALRFSKHERNFSHGRLLDTVEHLTAFSRGKSWAQGG
jgi:hypothetical protein